MDHPAAAHIRDLYERHASAWDRDRGRSPFFERSWLDLFAAEMPAGATVLDFGCGMGAPIAAYLIGRGFALTGIDSSPSLIDLCRERFPQGEWIVADMRQPGLGGRFGGLLAWDSFFHLTPDDQRGMFAVFRDRAADGAPLLFTSGPRHGEAIGSYEGEALYHASLDAGEYEALLRSHGFRLLRHVADDPACGGHTVWLARATQT